LSAGFKGVKDAFERGVHAFGDIIVRESQNLVAQLSQSLISFVVSLSHSLVAGTTQLDDKHRRQADEVYNKSIDCMLTPELRSES